MYTQLYHLSQLSAAPITSESILHFATISDQPSKESNDDRSQHPFFFLFLFFSFGKQSVTASAQFAFQLNMNAVAPFSLSLSFPLSDFPVSPLLCSPSPDPFSLFSSST
eukprot:TRINITY_DN10927_c1_g2_i1.p2 TRINITY_DN10927_c1_g2~~TRINITY_DN10927_c1_g2_i1.p2  ORF type:complete len:109 (-),score=6.60 TRINITY_DN10927_c1_g2_i1:344-670(-)